MEDKDLYNDINHATERTNEAETAFEEESYIINDGFTISEAETVTEKPPKKWKSIVIICAILILCVVIAVTASLFVFDFLGIGFGRDGKNAMVEIEKGATTTEIAQELKEQGVIEFPMFFRMYSKLKGYDGKYNYGLYTFQNDYGYKKTAEKLAEEGKPAENVTVRIPEGATVDIIADLLVENGVCTKRDFINSLQYDDFDYDFVKQIDENDVYYRLEGYLYPDTYNFYSYDSKECAHLAIEKMLSNLNKKLDKSLKKSISSSKYSFHQIMTMASIVELESGSQPQESANVAAVFYNRLDDSGNFPTLGSSPTIKYPYGNDRYNTYKSKGLPPGPLCSMSINSIRAAANPTENFDYYYFVTDKDMKFYYNKTLAQHNSTISKLKSKGLWIYEYIE